MTSSPFRSMRRKRLQSRSASVHSARANRSTKWARVGNCPITSGISPTASRGKSARNASGQQKNRLPALRSQHESADQHRQARTERRRVIIVGGRRRRNSLPAQREPDLINCGRAWVARTDRPIWFFENTPSAGRGMYLRGQFVAANHRRRAIKRDKGCFRRGRKTIWFEFPPFSRRPPNIASEPLQACSVLQRPDVVPGARRPMWRQM